MEGFNVSSAQKFLNTGNIESTTTMVGSDGIAGQQSDGKSFADTLNDAIHKVNKLQKVSDQKMQDLATGKTDNIPEVMIAAEKADIALKLMVQVRSKIIDAYQEIMKMQV